jgi:hypothetical protein
LRFAPGVLNVLLIALLGLVVPLSRIRLRPTVTIALAGALAVLYALVAQLAFDSGTIVSFVYPLLALALGTASANAVDGILDRRERVNLKSELSRLPSDSSAFFVSYRRDQSSWPADALEKALSARFGSASVFQDSASIAAGEEWPKRIADAVSKCNVMLVLIGPYWLEARTADGSRRIDDPRDWVRLEIETALDAGCVVVPILLDGAVQPKAEQLPASLQPLILRQAMALTTENWNAQLDALLSSIHDGRVREFLASERAAQGGAESARPTGSPED